MKLHVKKIVTLSLTFAFVMFTAYSIYSKSPIPDAYTSMVGMVVSYYFGRGSVSNDKTNNP